MGEGARKLVQSELFLALARASMVLATLVVLPIALGVGGWYANRIVATGDKIVSDVATLQLQVQLTQQQMKFGQEVGAADRAAMRAQLGDHETRIRSLELAERPSPIRR